jgi:hypothetical protein
MRDEARKDRGQYRQAAGVGAAQVNVIGGVNFYCGHGQ